MRRVIGRRQEPLTGEVLSELAAPYERVVIDVGTGAGQAVLRRARREASALVIGVDAVAEQMREASHRAARPASRGGAGNAVFVVAAAEELPGVLAGRADEVTVVLPWGSLLRGLLAADEALLRGLAALLRRDGRLELLLSLTPTDAAAGTAPLDETAVNRLAQAYAELGLVADEVRPAEEGDVERLASSWARRLGIPRRRPAWLLRLHRAGEGTAGRVAGV